MPRLSSCLLALILPAAAAELEHARGARTTPPTLNAVFPIGIARGTTVEITVEGLNLAKASAVYFSRSGVKGRVLRVKELPDQADVRLGSNGTPSTIDVGPLPPRNQVTLELQVDSDAEIGPVGFRLQTPLGTSPEGKFLIEPYYGETSDIEPNDTPENAVESFLPTILAGTISKPGDLDYYKIQVKAGDQLIFENSSGLIGSTLNPVVSILSAALATLREFGPESNQFSYRFESAGTYYIRVADFEETGKPGNFYRIKVGRFPLLRSAYPLGLQSGTTRRIALDGWNLGAPELEVEGRPNRSDDRSVSLRPNHSFNELKLALEPEPEIEAAAQAVQPVSVPMTINGRLAPSGAGFRFHATKGRKYIIEVNAARLGSKLDSFIEVLDSAGHPIERATVRAVSETFLTLTERNSVEAGIRLQNGNDLKPGNFVMIGNEIIRVESLPQGPDDDTRFERVGGQRLAYFDTTTEAHAVEKPVYKVQIHPPGAKFSPNGLPLIHLFYQNDDGGPGYGKDSLLHFTAPADADYIVRLRDIRGLGGEQYPYRLTIREPRPDFRLSVANRNPNVPVGGCIPANVTAVRLDDFDGAIQVAVEDLPVGLRATEASIPPGQISTTLLLCASADAHLEHAAPLKVVGRCGQLRHIANPEDDLTLVSLMPKPDVIMTAETEQVTLAQGGEAQVTVHIARQNEFKGRVPVDVRNLPPHVLLPDVGLNGVLINENETRRTFTIRALPDAPPIEQLIYVGGLVETRSNLASIYAAPEAIRLRIVPRP